jgi:hypothetical protein
MILGNNVVMTAKYRATGERERERARVTGAYDPALKYRQPLTTSETTLLKLSTPETRKLALPWRFRNAKILFSEILSLGVARLLAFASLCLSVS